MALHKMNDGCVGRALNEIRYADHIKKESVYTGYKDLDKVLGGIRGSRPIAG